MIEDAMIVYRLTRAPERRAFYIDVGSLPKKAAEEYLTAVMNKHRSKMVYNAVTGMVEGNAHQISMMEDFWLPRREGGKGTEVTTLDGASNLGDIDDVLYFQRKLYKSLNVPSSRLESDSTINIGGRSAEVTRDEWKFNKFIQRLRRRFSGLFDEILMRQLVLKNITTPEDWMNDIKPNIKYIYSSDSFAREQQESDLLNDQLTMLERAEPFLGTYFSKDSIERKVLGRGDDEIKKEADKIKEELGAGMYPDPHLNQEDFIQTTPAPQKQNSDFTK